MAKKIFLRALLLIVIMVVGFLFVPNQIHSFVVNTLGYRNPPGFFGFTFNDWGIASGFFMIFLVGIVFGTLGKKIDYIFIALVFVLMSLNNYFTENMTWTVYFGFVGAAILGNLIGYLFKQARLHLSPQWR